VEMAEVVEASEDEDDDDDTTVFDVCKQWCILMQYTAIIAGLFLIFLMQLVGMLVPPDFATSNTAAQMREGLHQFYSTLFKGRKWCPCDNVTAAEVAFLVAAAASGEDDGGQRVVISDD
jgi:hypothetical protein